ncbi:MAG: hypothetical protein RMK89_10435 [Armatimonadota bacterium]|nr:hypothetical protein [Armatimonadota bacterium]MDW8143866.1 hypothetical protein [Armatimonadota bacterium]
MKPARNLRADFIRPYNSPIEVGTQRMACQSSLRRETNLRTKVSV